VEIEGEFLSWAEFCEVARRAVISAVHLPFAHESHLVVVIPLILTPCVLFTRWSRAPGPG
jgi:hypothetical protein